MCIVPQQAQREAEERQREEQLRKQEELRKEQERIQMDIEEQVRIDEEKAKGLAETLEKSVAKKRRREPEGMYSFCLYYLSCVFVRSRTLI